MGLLMILLTLTLLLKSAISEHAPKYKILDGEFAIPGQFPFIVSLRRSINYRHFCAGSILTEYWVLTAAHCLVKKQPERVLVVAGTLENNGPQDPAVPSLRFVPHPSFTESSNDFFADIALLQPLYSFVFTKSVRPVKIGTFNMKSPLIAAGWGRINNIELTRTLKFVDMEVFDKSESCQMTEYMFCAGPKSGTTAATTCSGDSGGPVVDASQGKLVGITSFGWIDCDNLSEVHDPDVYTRVDAFVGWIKLYVKDL